MRQRLGTGPHVYHGNHGVTLCTSIYHGRLSACQPSLYATRWGIYPTRCCVDFQIVNTCFVSGFTQYKQVQQHFRVYTVILRLSLRPREQYVIPTDGATNAPVPLQGSSSSNNPRKGKESTPSKRWW